MKFFSVVNMLVYRENTASQANRKLKNQIFVMFFQSSIDNATTDSNVLLSN